MDEASKKKLSWTNANWLWGQVNQAKKKGSSSASGVKLLCADELEKMDRQALLSLIKTLLQGEGELSKAIGERLDMAVMGLGRETLAPTLKKLRALEDSYEWGDAKEAEKLIDNLLEPLYDGSIELYANRESARLLIETLYPTVVGLFNCVDDCHENIAAALGLMEYIIPGLALYDFKDDEEREKTFELFLSTAKRREFSGWEEYALRLVESASGMIKKPAEEEYWREQVNEFRRAFSEKGNFWWDQTVVLEYEVMTAIHGEEACQSFLEQHQDVRDLRSKAFEQAINTRDWARAEEVARGGVAAERQRSETYVSEWHKKLAQVLEQQKGKEEELKELLFFIATQDNNGFTFYQKHKAFKQSLGEPWGKEEVTDFLEALKAANVSKTSRYGVRVFEPKDYMAKVYEEEEMWGELMKIAARNFSFLKQYWHRLHAQFPDASVERALSHIEKHANQASNRRAYGEVAGELQWLSDQGKAKEAEDLCGILIEKNKRRPAMVDELSRVLVRIPKKRL